MKERIVIAPKICHGKPVVRGTRTPVTVLLDALAGGDTFETLQSDYDITADQIRASGKLRPATVEPVRPVRAVRMAAGEVANGDEYWATLFQVLARAACEILQFEDSQRGTARVVNALSA